LLCRLDPGRGRPRARNLRKHNRPALALRARLAPAGPGRVALSVDPARERRALDAFDVAIDWPEETREARLAEYLADDPDLIATVQAMIAAELETDLLPTRPPEPLGVLADIRAPERVGAYRPGALIGRGGMGSVYRGE